MIDVFLSHCVQKISQYLEQRLEIWSVHYYFAFSVRNIHYSPIPGAEEGSLIRQIIMRTKSLEWESQLAGL